jgi:hypothetical protein
VALNARQKRALGRELRDVVFRLCTAGGLALGVLWGVYRHYVQTSQGHHRLCGAHPASRAVSHLLGRCAAAGLSDVMLSWLIPAGLGLLVGALLGLLLTSEVRLVGDSAPLGARARR